jgi:glycine oxidase
MQNTLKQSSEQEAKGCTACHRFSDQLQLFTKEAPDGRVLRTPYTLPLDAIVISMQTNSDVIIIGGGIIGLGIARELSGRGLSITLLERHQPGREASWASGGMLAPQGELSEGDFLKLCLASNQRYPAFRAAVEAETGLRCYHRDSATMALAFTDEDEKEFRNTYTRQKADHLVVEWITGDKAREIEPALSEHVRGGMLLPGDNHIENRLLAPAIEQACRQRGVQIICGALVSGLLVEHGKTIGVDSVLGKFYAGTVVNAAGAWAASIGVPDESLRPPVFPVRGQMMAITPPRPSFLSRAVRSPRSYLIPRHDNRLFLGATMEEVGFDKRHTVWGVQKLLNGAVELFPELQECSIQEMWVGLRPGTSDNHPVLGATSLPGYILATGLFRNGLLLTPIIVETISELVASGQTSALIAPFNIDRFADGLITMGKVPGA